MWCSTSTPRSCCTTVYLNLTYAVKKRKYRSCQTQS
uniref:Uncharacterized protein n=1 Tax=Anguilla anguilla TaxID=7936 RepID=A0A0E9RY98_ANGAN